MIVGARGRPGRRDGGQMTGINGTDGDDRGRRHFPASPPWGDADPAEPPPEILRRWGTRVLDPSSAGRFPDEGLRPTSYLADRLLVPWSWYADDERRNRLESIVGEAGYGLERDQRTAEYARYLWHARGADVAVPARLRPRRAEPGPPPDAWNVLQNIRAKMGRDAGGPALDHLMVAVRPPSMVHSVVEEGTGVLTGGTGYAPGGRTRMPVSLPIAPLLPRTPDAELTDRRPVVAVLDTGCG